MEKKLLAYVSLLALLPATGLAVPTVYTYTGGGYSSFQDDLEIPGTYDRTMRITGSVTLADTIPPNSNLHFEFDSASLLSFNFFDGRIEYTKANAVAPTGIEFDTNASGELIRTAFRITTTTATGLPVNTGFAQLQSGSHCQISGWCDAATIIYTFPGTTTYQDTAHSTTPGIWTVTPIPEPSTYAMFLAGIALVGFAVRHRNKVPL